MNNQMPKHLEIFSHQSSKASSFFEATRIVTLSRNTNQHVLILIVWTWSSIRGCDLRWIPIIATLANTAQQTTLSIWCLTFIPDLVNKGPALQSPADAVWYHLGAVAWRLRLSEKKANFSCFFLVRCWKQEWLPIRHGKVVENAVLKMQKNDLKGIL